MAPTGVRRSDQPATACAWGPGNDERGDVVQKPSSTQNLGKMEENQVHTATFFLSISLRGSVAEQVHQQFLNLLGITALQLIGLSMKRAMLKRSQMAQQVAALAYGR